MKSLRFTRRAGAVAATLAVLATGAGPAASAPGHNTQRVDGLRMFVESISPSVPVPTSTPKLITVTIRLENTTDTDYKGVKIVGERGDPIQSQATLDTALRTTSTPSTPGLPIPAVHPTVVDIGALGTVHTTFTARYSRADDGSGLCLCQDRVYPLYFSAHITGDGGVDQRLGVVGTYVPSFVADPAPDRVTWIWPLIDRPHRLLQDAVFTDDELAGTVASGGRLDRALQVVERTDPTVPLTLVIDPELIDELTVMAGSSGYRVQAADKTVPGTGNVAAANWLGRLRSALDADPRLQLAFTPYADPDIESLNRENVSWTNAMPPQMRARIGAALPGRALDATVAWPAGGAISSTTLRLLAARGTSTVVLNQAAVLPRVAESAVPSGLARLDSGNTDLAAALVSPTIENDVVKGLGPTGPAELPQLIAELAIRAAQEPGAEHAVVITAPRYVDPSVDAAVRTIKDTSQSTFAKPISLTEMVGGELLPTGRSRLAPVPASAAGLPATTVAATSQAAGALPDVTSLLTPHPRKGAVARPDPAAEALLASLPVAIQRAASSAWRQKDAASAAAAAQFARGVSRQIDSIENGVQIIRPSSGSYTLASESSPLPITVDNKLPYPVTIRISITTDVNGLPGFSTKDIGLESVDSNQKRTLKVPTTTVRKGRIKVHVALLTPNGVTLGESVPLTVRSTVLGLVGVVITIVAGVVLVLALLIRVGRQMRGRRRTSSQPRDTVAARTGGALA
ncbi:MAG: DUF6049 family protein [Jatrophihabitans sp.]|uniref:DUF6049 family protein n=1 Tax=Jatrophihabitans sp. TaxID=1932789 RepID=UPI0039108CED